ncbi:uncharacterized protein RHIMIDRAFT_267745 [Rhizopus microsporus ATCC 52813]|uniref:Uncharacterized protein n=1 Tax=Rhizopus microsporus ATCC 52813 TaxID=1340429 RepID=A0A2G4SJ57_RHIZD|nr:uncharacterized protein RHIMIDRAFT_267745 [Rhizopus microsporus ATCC 52813]PHZ08807.1 hypothetical protein RHIMIDRAFT_267765 [Rhizopus microsporus ATCC 52813]
MSATNEYCFGATTYSKKKKKKQKKKTNQTGHYFSMLDHPKMLLLLWLCLYS